MPRVPPSLGCGCLGRDGRHVPELAVRCQRGVGVIGTQGPAGTTSTALLLLSWEQQRGNSRKREFGEALGSAPSLPGASAAGERAQGRRK